MPIHATPKAPAPVPTEPPARETWPLTAAIARGDERAFAAFYEHWFDRVLAMARAVTRRDEAFCLDVVQDTMLRAVRSLRAMSTERSVAAWMAKAVFSTAMDRLRAERRIARRERAAARPETGGVVPALEAGEQQRWLELRLAELPAADRALLRDRFEAGQTLEAIGAAHGLTGNAVHGRIWRVVHKLRAAAARVFDD